MEILEGCENEANNFNNDNNNALYVTSICIRLKKGQCAKRQ